MKKHIVIPLVVVLGCLVIFAVTQWQYPGGQTSTSVAVQEGSVEVASLADSGDTTTLSANEQITATSGKLGSKESLALVASEPIAVATEAVVAAEQPSQPADDTIEYPTKEGFWITGFSKTEDGKFIPAAEITVEKKGEEKVRYASRLVTTATFEALTDTHGHYEVQADGPGKYELRSHAPGYIGEFIDGFGNANLSDVQKTANVDLVHRAGSGYWIVGTVKNESGEPIPGSRISAYLDAHSPGQIFRAQSTDGGNYALKVSGPGKYSVHSEPPGEYIPAGGIAALEYSDGFFNEPYKQAELNFVHRAGGCLVHGRVIDKETTKPVPDARIHLFAYNRSGPGEGFTTFADSDGKFEIRVPEKSYSVSASAKGYVSYWGYENRGDGLDAVQVNQETAQREIVIELQRGLAVKFVVSDPAGNPVEGAAIYVFVSRCQADGRTDAKGECVIDTLSEGTAVAVVTKTRGKQDQYGGQLYRGMQESSDGKGVVSKAYSKPFMPGPQENPPVVEVTLYESASVSGRVTYRDSGNPVANRRISIMAEDFSAAITGGIGGHIETDDNGGYGFTELAPGRYKIGVGRETSFEDLASEDITLQASERRTDLDFAVEDEEEGNGIVEGKVVNEKGEPVPFANLHLFIIRDPQNPSRFSKIDSANEKGEFKITGLPKADSLCLYVQAGGYSEIVGEEFPMNGEFLTITLKPFASISGVVLSKEKRIPVPNAKVSIQMHQGGTAFADTMGQFEIKEVQPGTYQVAAEAEGHASAKSAEIEIKAGQSVRDVVIELESGMEFAGILVGPMRNPVAGGIIGLESKVRNTNKGFYSTGFQPVPIPDAARSGEDGSFRIGGIPAQGDTLLISHPQFAPRKFTISPEMLGRDPIPVPLTEGGAIEGTVMDHEQKPVQGTRIGMFNYPENLYCYNTITNENGEYRIEHLPAVRFHVTCQQKGLTSSDDKEVWIEEGKTIRADFGTGEGATIRGTVYKDGTPVPNALVQLERTVGEDRSRTVAARQDGTYQFIGISPGRCAIRFTVEEGARYVGWPTCDGIERLAVAPEQKEYTVDLHARSFEVVGTVRDAETKEPIPGVSIRIRPTMDLPLEVVSLVDFILRRIKTDDQGGFRARLPEPHVYPMAAIKKGYVDGEFSVTVQPAQGPSEIPVEVFLSKADTSVLLHLSFQGQPVTLTNRRFYVIQNGAIHQTDSIPLEDQPGAYRLPGMRPGPMELIVESEEDTRTLFAYPQLITLERGQEGRMFIDLFSAVIYELQLRTSDNSPVPMDFRVEAPEVPGLARLEGCRFVKGLPYFVPLPVGRYRVNITAPGYQPLEFISADIAEPTYTSGRAMVSVQLVK